MSKTKYFANQLQLDNKNCGRLGNSIRFGSDISIYEMFNKVASVRMLSSLEEFCEKDGDPKLFHCHF